MFSKLKYKIWRHLNKRISTNRFYIEKEQNKQATAQNSIENAIANLNQEILDIKNMLILKELFPNAIKNSLPNYEELEQNNYLSDALNRSYFQTSNEGSYLRKIFACRLEEIARSLKSVAGGITAKQYASILGGILHSGIKIDNIEQKFLYTSLASHCKDNPLYDVIKQEIHEGNFRNYGEYFWRLFLNLLIHQNDLEIAKKALKHYENKFGLNNIKNHLLLASLAYETGHKDDEFKYANTIYQSIKKSEEENLFENLITNKSIAIVGNGPQQNGKKTGKEIDSHDIVIRFNTYADDEKYFEDLGSKTDIWCNWILYPLSSHNIEKIKYIILATDIYTWQTLSPEAPGLWKELYDYIQSGGKILTYPYDQRKEVLDDIDSATSGFSMVRWIKKLKPDFKKTNCYGFSFTEDNLAECTKTTWHHFDGIQYQTNRMVHSLNKEKEILDKLFEN